MLVTDPVFADRVRRSGDEEIAYGLIPASMYWNNIKIPGRVYCERQSINVRGGGKSVFPPLTRSRIRW